MSKYEYFNIKGERMAKRSNFSPLKLQLLKGLYELDRSDTRADMYDDKFQNRFYNIRTIAKFIRGDAAFNGGKLNENDRTILNRSLRALYTDGYVDLDGVMREDYGVREFNKNHWMISREGIRVLAAVYNRTLTQFLNDNRYVGWKGVCSRKDVVKVLMVDSWTYEDKVIAGDPAEVFNAQKKLMKSR